MTKGIDRLECLYYPERRMQTKPEYVFEILQTDPVFPGCVGFRRADMQNAVAREALIVILQVQFQIPELDLAALDEVLKGVPLDWGQFLKATPTPKGIPLSGLPPLMVTWMEREPGKDSGGNPVITDVTVKRAVAGLH